MPKIGLVTVLYHSNDLLEDFLKSLSAQKFKDYHLYLVDNSENNTAGPLIDELAAKYPITSKTYIKNEFNAGIARGYNQGIIQSMSAGTTYTIVLNNDIVFSDSLILDKLITTALDSRETIIVPKIFYYNTSKIWSAGGEISLTKGITWHRGEGKHDAPEFSKPSYTGFSPGCFIFISNSVFDEVGLMDEDYFVYYEDSDFLFRARKKGFKIWFNPEISIFHKVSAITGGSDSQFSIYYMERNRIYFILKNLEWQNKVTALFYTLFQMLLKMRYYNLKQMGTYFSGVIDGFKRPVRSSLNSVIAINCLLIFL